MPEWINLLIMFVSGFLVCFSYNLYRRQNRDFDPDVSAEARDRSMRR